KAFIDGLNTKIEQMLTADVYKAGGSEYYKNSFLILTKQMDNMYKVKPNLNFFEEITKQFDDFNDEYKPDPVPDPDPDPTDPTDPPVDPEPEPPSTGKLFPVKIQNG